MKDNAVYIHITKIYMYDKNSTSSTSVLGGFVAIMGFLTALITLIEAISKATHLL